MEHLFVGVWAVEVHEPGKPHVERVTYACNADGVVAIAAATYAAHGVWVATGERSGSVTALLPVPPGEGFSGWLTMQATVEVAADGRTFEMDATVYRPTPNGATTQRPARLVAERLTIGGHQQRA